MEQQKVHVATSKISWKKATVPEHNQLTNCKLVYMVGKFAIG
jgi:hypothetical protein